MAGHAFPQPDLVDGLRNNIAASHKLTLGAVRNAGLVIAGETALFALVRHADAATLRDRLAASHVLTRAFNHTPDMLRIGLVANAAEAALLTAAPSESLAEQGP